MDPVHGLSLVLHSLALEAAFNNTLRELWHLPRRTHTGIVHFVANLISLFNTICHSLFTLYSSLYSELHAPH